jgi:cytochrome c-type biogenesis protein CcmH/NrfG
MTDSNLTPPVADSSGQEILRQGWRAYVDGRQPDAESEFRQVLSREPENVEAWYALGLALKLQRKNAEAITAFQKVITLIQTGGLVEDPNRGTMLRHISEWHVETLRAGQNQEPQP